MKQFKKYDDDNFKLTFARSIVKGKIKNELNVIRGFSYNHPEIQFSDEMGQLESSLDRAGSADVLGVLLGVEGFASRTYFQGFGKMILGPFTFSGRRKRPPPDPVNALLSLGYTMIYNEVSSLLDGLGFDPFLGCFHKVEYGRASLASDLQEEFRPVIERFTLYLVNKNILAPEDFFTNPASKGVYLKRNPLKKYFKEYEEYMTREFVDESAKEVSNFRKAVRMQAEKLAACIKDGSVYTPFQLSV